MSPHIVKRISMTALLTGTLFTSVLLAGDLASYRDFRLGMDLAR